MNRISRRSFFAATAAGTLAAGALPAQGAEPGRIAPLEGPIPLEALNTPALLVDIDAFETNLKTMADHLKAKGVGLRPHAKTHKCPHMALRQIEMGAIGICCAKVSEAEVMAAAGVANILITSPVVTKEKIGRVVALAARTPGLQLVVDNAGAAADLAAAAEAAGLTMPVLIDLESGSKRTGVAMGAPALALAQAVAKMKPLRLDGLQCYAGHVMHRQRYGERRAESIAVMAAAAETRALIEAAGIPLKVLTGGGTGTFDIDSAVPGVTDLQCGSYAVMDVQYGILEAEAGRLFDVFPPSMFVWSTAISQPVPGRITIDAGFKAIYDASPRSVLRDFPEVRYDGGGDEHGILGFPPGPEPIALGDKVAIVVAHCDPTINLYDRFHAVRGGEAVELWPIAARGMAQ